jgi:glycosyltransferase involved in cell wall biosynthesis
VSNKNYFIVIPAFNESATIREVVQKALHYSNNVVVVDDGSADDTISQLVDLPVIILANKVNKGKAASLMRGFNYALENNADAIISLDGDEQHDANDIPKLITAHEQQEELLIIGARLENNEEAPSNRLWANRFADFWVSWAASHQVRDSQSGFRLYPTKLLKKTGAAHGKYWGFVFETEIIINAARKGFYTSIIPIKSCYPEKRRESHYRPWRDITKTVLMIMWKIISRGLNIPGLIRSQSQAHKAKQHHKIFSKP